jgi:hypothetical protein
LAPELVDDPANRKQSKFVEPLLQIHTLHVSTMQ